MVYHRPVLVLGCNPMECVDKLFCSPLPFFLKTPIYVEHSSAKDLGLACAFLQSTLLLWIPQFKFFLLEKLGGPSELDVTRWNCSVSEAPGSPRFAHTFVPGRWPYSPSKRRSGDRFGTSKVAFPENSWKR